MITDGVEDLKNGLAKIYYEKDEAKQVLLHKRSQFAYFIYCVIHLLFWGSSGSP